MTLVQNRSVHVSVPHLVDTDEQDMDCCTEFLLYFGRTAVRLITQPCAQTNCVCSKQGCGNLLVGEYG